MKEKSPNTKIGEHELLRLASWKKVHLGQLFGACYEEMTQLN